MILMVGGQEYELAADYQHSVVEQMILAIGTGMTLFRLEGGGKLYVKRPRWRSGCPRFRAAVDGLAGGGELAHLRCGRRR